MKKSPLVLLAVLFVFSPCSAAETAHDEDMQFIRELRDRGYSDFASLYLKNLIETAPPSLRKELTLELALTKMEAAATQPDSGKRITIYTQARADFQQFLKANPKHPRADEARFAAARATGLQGKTQLNRALLEGDKQTRIADGVKARATLADALKQLQSLPAKPETELAMALNLLDQSKTYLNTDFDEELINRNKPIQQAQEILDKLAEGDNGSKITWTARAWAGRCLDLLDAAPKAIEKYNQVMRERGPAARDGKRLASYFLMLAYKKLKKGPDLPNGKAQPLDKYLEKAAKAWLTTYASYKHTDESYGVRFLRAENMLAESENPKLPTRSRKILTDNARKLLHSIEESENDFTDRAKRLKLAVMNKQGVFKKPIDTLKTFENCYVRAQFEQMQIGEDAKKYQGKAEQIEAARKARIQDIIKALQAALAKPDAKDAKINSPLDYYNARLLLTYYLLNESKYKEAIAIGEDFAKNDPKPSQASMSAIYALLAYGQLLGEQERKAGDAKLLQDNKAYQQDKANMLVLAKLMQQRWPTERAGDLARHQIAIRLLGQDQTEEAIATLRTITPSYPSYIRTQFLLARTELQQSAQDKADAKGYRKNAIATLTALPEPKDAAGADINRDYVSGKLLLLSELAKARKLKELDALAKTLSPKLDKLKVVDDDGKNAELRGKFKDSLVRMSLYSTVVQADVDFKAAKYTEVAKRLDPLVDQFNAGKMPQLKSSELTGPMLALALKANIQLSDLKKAEQVIKALQALQADQGGKGVTTILAQLVNLITQQMDDLRKKGDKTKLEKAKAGFTAILNNVAGSQTKPTPLLSYLLAKCYSGMGEHEQAVKLLEKFSAAQGKAEQNPDVKLLHAMQLLLVGEYRHMKETDKAQKMLDEIIGTKQKPGWGNRDLQAQRVRILLLEDKGEKGEKGYYRQGAMLCDSFVKQLLKHIDDNKMKEQYFWFYYHLVNCVYKHGMEQSDSMQKAKYIKDAARRMIALEKAQGGFGSVESTKLFSALLEKEADLHTEYEAQKKSK